MNIVILHFSARSNGNCASIAQYVAAQHPGESIRLLPMAQTSMNPCHGCHYECFTHAESCPYAAADVRAVYDAILHADLAYLILPNYADSPPALYYTFNERSQCVFQGNETLLNDYLAVPKRFIFVSNQPAPAFEQLPQYHISAEATPAKLYLAPRRFSASSTSGNLMEAPEAQAMLRQFIHTNEKNAGL